MQYFQNIFILLDALNVRVSFQHKTIVVSCALCQPQVVKIWADRIGNCPRSLQVCTRLAGSISLRIQRDFSPCHYERSDIYIHKFYKKNQDFQICVAAYFIPLFLTQSASQMLIPNYISIIFVVILLERILSPDQFVFTYLYVYLESGLNRSTS